MKFNASLDKEQIDEIASVTADKVLATVQYHKNNEDWQEGKIQDLKAKIAHRDSMIVNNEIQISRLREKIDRLRSKLKEYEDNDNVDTMVDFVIGTRLLYTYDNHKDNFIKGEEYVLNNISKSFFPYEVIGEDGEIYAFNKERMNKCFKIIKQ